MKHHTSRIRFGTGSALACTLAFHAAAQNAAQKPPTADELTNEMIKADDPCAGSPNEAVCRCALEFPPVTYDTQVLFRVPGNDQKPEDSEGFFITFQP